MIKQTYTVEELQAMPTLCQGQTDDLKVDDGNNRVWLSRMTLADGEIYQIHHEECIGSQWVIVSEYAPFD